MEDDDEQCFYNQHSKNSKLNLCEPRSKVRFRQFSSDKEEGPTPIKPNTHFHSEDNCHAQDRSKLNESHEHEHYHNHGDEWT